jgi:hypothetical protein
MNVPDWLWQGLVEEAVWTGIFFSAAWAWKNREQIEQRLRGKRTIRANLTDELSTTDEATTTVRKEIDLRWNVRRLVSKDIDLRWRVEAPAPSLARRLEDLAAWYLHVS